MRAPAPRPSRAAQSRDRRPICIVSPWYALAPSVLLGNYASRLLFQRIFNIGDSLGRTTQACIARQLKSAQESWQTMASLQERLGQRSGKASEQK